MGDKWWKPVWCDECGVEMVYDEGDGMLHCPKCENVAYAFEEDIEDQVERDVKRPVREALQKYRPGEFLFRGYTAEEVADVCPELGKKKWGKMVCHDYLLAILLKKDYVMKKMREAHRILALKMGWDVEAFMKIFPILESDLKKSTLSIPYTLYELMKDEIKVDGWRVREDETFYEGSEIRDLYLAPSEVGEAVRLEWQRWNKLHSDLSDMYWEARKKGNRLLCWIIKNLLKEGVHFEMFNDPEHTGFLPIDADPYPDSVVEDILSGRDKEGVGLQAATVQMHLGVCEFRMHEECERYEAGEDIDMAASSAGDAAERMVLAVAAKLGWETLNHRVKEREYAYAISERFEDPEIKRLYDMATDLCSENYRARVEAARAFIERMKGIFSALPDNPVKTEGETTPYIS